MSEDEMLLLRELLFPDNTTVTVYRPGSSVWVFSLTFGRARLGLDDPNMPGVCFVDEW